MPNYVKNNVLIRGDKETIKKVEKVLLKKGVFSFSNVIPMPKSIFIESSSVVDKAIDAIKSGRKAISEFKKKEDKWEKGRGDKYIKLGHTALKNIEKYGAKDWYDWSINNWGTKWDALESTNEVSDTEISLSFNTAWNAPYPIYAEIAKKFPAISIDVEYADEGLGNNCGTLSFENGGLFEETEGDFEFACSLWGYDPRDFEEE